MIELFCCNKLKKIKSLLNIRFKNCIFANNNNRKKYLVTEDYEHNTLKSYINIVEPKFSHLPLVTCL